MKIKDKVTVEKVYQRKEDSVTPVMLKFENGYLSTFLEDNVYFGEMKHKTDNKKPSVARLTVNGSTYEGPFNSNQDQDSLTDNYICVRNKKTNKMRIIPVESVKLRNTVYQELEKEQKQFELSEEMSKKTLLKKFGGRKAMKALRGREEMNMKIDMVQNDLQAHVDESVIEEDVLNNSDMITQNTAYFDSIRPPYNTSAPNIKSIYKLQSIVPEAVLSNLEEDAKLIFQMKTEHIPVQSLALLNKVTDLQKKPASPGNILHMQVLLYMDSLLSIIQSRLKSMESLQFSNIGKKIAKNLYREFADPNISVGFVRTNYSHEKALCYYIVLSLLLQTNYEVNIETLSQELKTSKQKVIQYGRVVFAMPRQRKTVLALQIPGKVTPITAGQGKKRAFSNRRSI